MLQSWFHDAIYVSDSERVVRIIENKTLDLRSVLLCMPYASRRMTPIGLAARRGHVNICRILVEAIEFQDSEAEAEADDKQGPIHSLLNRLDHENRTALSHASEKGHWEVIQFLLSEKDIDIETGGMHHDESWTNLHWACRFGHHQSVQLLLDRGANINAQTSKKS